MKRSTFLKTLGLTAAAAFCNIKVFAVPQFALPAPHQPIFDIPPLPEELTNAGLLSDVVEMCYEFARDAIDARPAQDDEGNRKHIAIESGVHLFGQRLTDDSSVHLIDSIRWLIEEAVRAETSVRICEWHHSDFYDDPLPMKFRDEDRISPYASTYGPYGLKFFMSNKWQQAPETHGIPKPLRKIFSMQLEVKTALRYDEEGMPRGWVARAILSRANIFP